MTVPKYHELFNPILQAMQALVAKLKDLRIGVRVEMIESVSVQSDWFDSLE